MATKNVTFNLKVPAGLMRELKVLSRESGASVAALVRIAVEHWLNGGKKNGRK